MSTTRASRLIDALARSRHEQAARGVDELGVAVAGST
jgi:hypothetical protein